MPLGPALEPTRKVVLPSRRIERPQELGSQQAPAPALGAMTRQFFLEGEAHEAANYEDVILDDAVEAPRVEFDSFDKIPRNRSPCSCCSRWRSRLGSASWGGDRPASSVKAPPG